MHALLYRGDDLVREIYDITFTRQPFLMMERDGTIHQAHALEYRGFYPWCRTFALDTWRGSPGSAVYREIELVRDDMGLDHEPWQWEKRSIKRILDV